MWGRTKLPFVIGDNYAVDVHNLTAARSWYKEKLELQESNIAREDDSGRPFVDLCVSQGREILSLVELTPEASPERQHVIFFSKNLEATHQWLAARRVLVESLTTDSGGNRLFRFRDLDGNAIEVCVEP